MIPKRSGNVGFIAITPTGIVAAYYGVIPCHFLLNGETVKRVRNLVHWTAFIEGCNYNDACTGRELPFVIREH